MADPVYDYITEQGVIVPDTASIQAEVEQEYRDVFGQDLIVSPNTPQGVLITSEVLGRTSVAFNNAELANQINPNIAGGIFLDAILALTGAERIAATFTTVECTLTGVPGTIIPSGSLAKDSVNGVLFESTETVTLSSGSPGTAMVLFQATEPGSITVTASTINQIVTGIVGWETVNNASIQTSVGELEQSDSQARIFRRQTLATQGSALAEAIIAALFEVPNVTSVSFLENVASTTEVIEGVTMVGHSLYACVRGGVDLDVAEAIMSKKSGGCNFNNGASGDPVDQPVVIPFSNQTIIVKFDRPDIINFLVRATVKVDGSIVDPTDAVKSAILAYVRGEIPGDAGLTIGTPVSCFELAGAVNTLYPQIFVANMETSLAPPDPTVYSNAEIPIAIYEQGLTDTTSITVNFI